MNNTYEYIEVAVALPLNPIYTYKVPESLRPHISPGKRALVPFGPRRITGYITGAGKNCGTYKIKEIFDILDEIPLFLPSMIPLFKWISAYYMHPMGEVIKTALPGGINRNDSLLASLAPGGCDVTPMLTDTERKIIEHLSAGQTSAKAVEKKTGASTSQMRNLEKKGLICLERELTGGKTRPSTEKYVEYTGLELPAKGTTKKREKVIEALKETPSMAVKRLNTLVPLASGCFPFLETHGIITLTEKNRYHDSFGESIEPDTAPELTPEQQHIVDMVGSAIGAGFTSHLLFGVTGSGKTEVYMKLAEEALNKGLTALVLVPEISLISQTDKRFRSRFGNKIAVLHSGLSDGERFDQWMLIAEGKVSIVIGARSAIFAPLENIGIIIVDEEHDSSYKQESGLRYNARDIAVVRAKFEKSVALLGSATPSVQSFYNVTAKKFSEVRLTKRVNERPMPEIEIVDLRNHRDEAGIHKYFTPKLIESMNQTLEKGEQILLFLNRRGFSNSPVCAGCGESMKCINCDVSMTLHKHANAYQCHTCGFMAPANSRCRVCNSPDIKLLGMGTEKVEEAVKALFPKAATDRMDHDTTQKKGSILKILKRVNDKKTDILIGTQMIAKGHDFPGITLVGIICADLSLNFPDFRAGERTFQLLAQVAGRAGRGDTPGHVVMQTYNPEHFSILAARDQDFITFYDKEIGYRKALQYPPFSRMVQIRMSGTNLRDTRAYAQKAGETCKKIKQNHPALFSSVQILGPIEAAIPKVANRYRWQIILKSSNLNALHRLSAAIQSECPSQKGKSDLRIAADVDPYYMM